MPQLTAESVLGPGGLFAAALDHWEARDSQLKMAQAIESRLAEGGPLIVEAPTGVGKTLAYLVPALLSGKRVIVSTNTKNLQEQIIDKDLPLLTMVLESAGVQLVRARASDEPLPILQDGPTELRFSLMKGRSNYLCLDRLRRKRAQRSFTFEFDLFEEIAQWSLQTERGDRSELKGLAERDPIWEELDARSEICTGSRCEKYESCFVVNMRKEAQNASLIVVNHHLLLADISLKAQASLSEAQRSFGEIIPAADALILDEAHTLEETASEYFGGQVSTRKLEHFQRDVLAHAAAPGKPDGLSMKLKKAVEGTEAVFAALPKAEGRARISAEGGARDGPSDEAPDASSLEGSASTRPARSGWSARAFSRARELVPSATRALEALAEGLEAPTRGEPDLASESLARRAREFSQSLSFVLGTEDSDYVYWSERQGKRAALGASPINVSHLLQEYLFGLYGSVVLTSATLSVGDRGCGFFASSIGAPEHTETMVLPSPYDFQRQAAIFMPSDAPEPTKPGADARLVDLGEELIELMGGGALYLFTSYRMMGSVYEKLKPRLKYPSMMQGEKPRGELLRDFVHQAPAVLFGTASFWEGVDVPGDALRLVLIDRLPFDSPSDPLVAARSEQLQSQGESAFGRYQLPRAILRLKQGFGRLIRRSEDRGVVAVLDRRLQVRGYGRGFLKALPDTRLIDDRDELRRFVRTLGYLSE